MEDPQKYLWQCTASVCVEGVHCWRSPWGKQTVGDLLGVSRSRECDLLSVLSIYRRIFLRVFIVYCLLLRFLFVLLYSAKCSCVLVVLV